MTFSIVARQGESYGVAVASKFLAVGAVVPAAVIGVAAVATQASARVAYLDELLERMRAGDDAADALYWLRVPRDERAQLTWDLSRELYSLAARNRGVFDEETGAFVTVSQDDFERRLPRAAFVLTRR